MLKILGTNGPGLLGNSEFNVRQQDGGAAMNLTGFRSFLQKLSSLRRM